MKAVVRDRYGSYDVVQVREIDKPKLPDDGAIVHVQAAALNPADSYSMSGTPYVGRLRMGVRRPKVQSLGTDYAGVVEAVGSDVTHLKPGDEVFGGRSGALAEYIFVRQTAFPKPTNLSFEEAAAVPVAAVTALQGLRNKGGIREGQRVLINGASGGVGTFAVQIAKAFGAEVTGVCSTRNVDIVRSLGADRVIDYTKEDFTKSGERYDLMLDVAGGRTWRDCRRVLTPDATLVIAGGPRGGPILGPLCKILRLYLAARIARQKVTFFIANFNAEDMALLTELLETGKVKPVIDKRYGLNEIADAFRYLGEGHAQGKVVISL